MVEGIVALSRVQVAADVPPRVRTRRRNGFTLSTEELQGGVRAAFLDFYHKTPCHDDFRPSHDAMESFKDGGRDAGRAFRNAIRAVAREFDAEDIGCVIPVIASRNTTVDADSPVGRLAREVATVLDVPLRLADFNQTPRDSLHKRIPLNFEKRYKRVHRNLRYVGRSKTRALLVDDVITTGATASAYRARLAATRGDVVGIVAVMKTEPSEPLLNPELHEDINLRD